MLAQKTKDEADPADRISSPSSWVTPPDGAYPVRQEGQSVCLYDGSGGTSLSLVNCRAASAVAGQSIPGAVYDPTAPRDPVTASAGGTWAARVAVSRQAVE
jgi:hypothetical protein